MDRFNALAQIIVDAFDGKTSPNGVVFRETAVNQVGLNSRTLVSNPVRASQSFFREKG